VKDDYSCIEFLVAIVDDFCIFFSPAAYNNPSVHLLYYQWGNSRILEYLVGWEASSQYFSFLLPLPYKPLVHADFILSLTVVQLYHTKNTSGL
jgi:hypothetical protein